MAVQVEEDQILDQQGSRRAASLNESHLIVTTLVES